MFKRKHPLVRIVWQDAYDHKDHLELSALSVLCPVVNDSVGWLLDENEERVVLSYCISTSGEYNFVVIPTGWIKERYVLEERKARRAAKQSPPKNPDSKD